MTITTDRLAAGSATGPGSTVIHTCPANVHQRVRTIYWTATGTLGLVQFGDSSGPRIVEETPNFAGAAGKPFDGWLVLETGDALFVNIAAATTVYYIVSGTTYTN